MKKFIFFNSPEKKVTTEVVLHQDKVEYKCPECGQIVNHGINGNKFLSISYPENSSEEQKMDHTHIYPSYIDVEYFAKRGLEIPVFKIKQMVNFVKENFQKQKKNDE